MTTSNEGPRLNQTVAQIRTSTIRALLVTAGVFFTGTFWLVVATYPSFFLFNPFAYDNPARAALLTGLIIGWVLLANAPAVIFGFFAMGHMRIVSLLPVVALLWPALLIVNHVSLAIVEGKWYTGYLLDYPIFFVTDLLLPAILLAIWYELRPVNHPVRAAVARHRA